MKQTPSKNEYILYRAWYNKDLQDAIMVKDVNKIEAILDQFTKNHLKNYDFELYDQYTEIDIDYVYNEHIKEILKLEM